MLGAKTVSLNPRANLWCCDRKSARAQKRAWVQYRGGACMRCGYRACPQALTFHHVDPTTKQFFISPGTTGSTRYNAARVGRTQADIYRELDKCALLCSNCHAELHADYWHISEIENKLLAMPRCPATAEEFNLN